MLIEGSIFNGTIVLDELTALPDGTRVRIEPIPAAPTATPVRQPIASLQAVKEKLARGRDNPPSPGPTLAETLAPFIGCLDGLPEDAAANHDQYVRNGLPKPTGANS